MRRCATPGTGNGCQHDNKYIDFVPLIHIARVSSYHTTSSLSGDHLLSRLGEGGSHLLACWQWAIRISSPHPGYRSEEGMLGRLNSFQKTMLQWNDVHPYSAVHVVQIAGRLDEERLRKGIQATLAARGLTHLSMDRAKGTYSY